MGDSPSRQLGLREQDGGGRAEWACAGKKHRDALWTGKECSEGGECERRREVVSLRFQFRAVLSMSIFSLPDDRAKSLRLGRQGKSVSSGKGGGIKSRCCGNSEVVRLGDVAARRGSRREGEGQMGRLFTHQRSAEGRARRRQGGESSFAGAFASGVLKLVAYRPAPARPDNGMQIRAKKRRPESSDRRCLLLFPGEGEARPSQK